jgi:hypothetical protein
MEADIQKGVEGTRVRFFTDMRAASDFIFCKTPQGKNAFEICDMKKVEAEV